MFDTPFQAPVVAAESAPVDTTTTVQAEAVEVTQATALHEAVTPVVTTNVIPQMQGHYDFPVRTISTKVRAPKQAEIDAAVAKGENPPLVWAGTLNFALPSVDADLLANYLLSEGDTPVKSYVVSAVNNAIQRAHYDDWLSRQDKTKPLNLNGYEVKDYTLEALANRPESDRAVYPEYDQTSEAAFLQHYANYLATSGKTPEQVATHVAYLEKDMTKLNARPADVRKGNATTLRAHVLAFAESATAEIKAECDAALDRMLARLERWISAEAANPLF